MLKHNKNATFRLLQIGIAIIALMAGTASAAADQECHNALLLRQLDKFPQSLGNYRIRTLKDFQESSEGGSLEYFYSKDTLQGLKAIYLGETGKTVFTYILSSKSTYAVEVEDTFYTAPISVDQSTIADRLQAQFVVCNGNPIGGIGDDGIASYQKRAAAILQKALKASSKAGE